MLVTQLVSYAIYGLYHLHMLVHCVGKLCALRDLHFKGFFTLITLASILNTSKKNDNLNTIIVTQTRLGTGVY